MKPAKMKPRCPNCGTNGTDKIGLIMPLYGAIFLGIFALFVVGLLVTIPFWAIEKTVRRNDPKILYGYKCGNCAHTFGYDRNTGRYLPI